LSWSSNNSLGAFTSPLKWTLAGGRNGLNGTLADVDSGGHYWSSTVSGTNSRTLDFNSSNANVNVTNRAVGIAVRCIKD
jgi:hypothetical protein